MKNKINTPFGDIHIKLNNEIYPFEYIEKKYYDSEERQYINMYMIDIDTENMKVGDRVFCGFEKKIMERNGTDEKAIFITTENETLLLGVCGYDTEIWDEESAICYSYELDDSDISLGLTYIIRRNPEDYINKFYKSKVITIGISWVEKTEFQDPDTTVFMALTTEIG